MSRRQAKVDYWQEAPQPRKQLVLVTQSLEALIPPDHPVRLVDEILDRLDWTPYEAKYHGRRGQPPIHPSVMAKTLLFAMLRRLRSSRQMEYELKHSIDFMWLTSGRQIDHTTLSEFRRQHADALRDIFRQMIQLAIDLGIAQLSELCIDGTRVLADANRYKTWTTERLERALAELDRQVAESLANLETTDAVEQDLFGDEHAADKLPPSVADVQRRREQLAALQEKTRDMDQTRKTNGSKGPAQLPKTDPDARILPNKEGGYAANYTPMATVETGGGLIVHCDVVIGNVEHNQLPAIIDTVQSDFATDVDRVLVDSAYTTGENLTAAESREIEVIGPLAETQVEHNPAIRSDPTQPVAREALDRLPINPQTKRFDKSAFVYDAASDQYFCPAGKPLPHRTTEHTTHGDGQPVVRSVYTCRDCAGCPLAARCRANPDSPRGREVAHDEHEAARRRHRARMSTAESQTGRSRRQHFGERPFAVIKAGFALRRFLLRGIEGVRQEWRWASTAFNLKRLMTLIAPQHANGREIAV
jgi:transposase